MLFYDCFCFKCNKVYNQQLLAKNWHVMCYIYAFLHLHMFNAYCERNNVSVAHFLSGIELLIMTLDDLEDVKKNSRLVVKGSIFIKTSWRLIFIRSFRNSQNITKSKTLFETEPNLGSNERKGYCYTFETVNSIKH